MAGRAPAPVGPVVEVGQLHAQDCRLQLVQAGVVAELQAAILRVQLPHLDGWADGRRRAAGHYEQAGLGELVGLPRAVAGSSPAWHLYVVSHPQVERLEAALASAGVGFKPYYRTPVHRQPPMRRWAGGVKLPGTELAARTHLAIPMSAVLTRKQAELVVAAAHAAAA